jgi:hypothetical protein
LVSSAVSALRTGREGFVAASMADAVNDLFTAKFLQVISGCGEGGTVAGFVC